MADVADVPRNRRRPKFTVDELEVLVDQMQRNKSTLLGKLSDVHAAQTKNDAWRAIAAMISAISMGCYANRAVENSNLFRKIAQNTTEKDISTTG